MSAPDRLPDEAIDGLLDGSPSEEAIGTPLAAYLAELRDDAQTTAAAPSEALQTVLAEGLDPADLETAGIPTAATGDEARRGILTWRLRARTAARVLVMKFAALGLLGKAAAAGAAVTVAASSAGVAGVLPEPAQHAFDDAIGREAGDAPADPADPAEPAGNDESDAADADTDAGTETPPETPADTSTTEPLDTDVSDDATSRSDGEPGVDGRDVAEDASDGRRRAPEDTPAGDGSQDPQAEADRGDEAVDEAPTDATPEEVPPTEPPAPAGDASNSAPADGRASERTPESASERPTNGDPRN